MRIQVVSDLHLEFHNLLPPVVEDADVLVCAGDRAPIGTGAVRYAAEEWAEARHILYVPGNHEYYGTDIDRGRKQLAEECYPDFRNSVVILMIFRAEAHAILCFC